MHSCTGNPTCGLTVPKSLLLSHSLVPEVVAPVSSGPIRGATLWCQRSIRQSSMGLVC